MRPTDVFDLTFRFEETGEIQRISSDALVATSNPNNLAGSVLDIAIRAKIDIDHSCGGYCACTTCHVKIIKGHDSCSALSDDEDDMLQTVANRDSDSRLACQCVPDGTQDLEIIVPTWRMGGGGGSTLVPSPVTGPSPRSGTRKAAEQPVGAEPRLEVGD